MKRNLQLNTVVLILINSISTVGTNQYTQEYMNNLCKNIEIILDIEEYIKHPRLNCLGNSELDMRDDKPTNKIEMCLKLFGISFIKRSTMFWWQN